MSIWDELGISPTKNVREIKKAYAAKTKLVHPEEHPEEFQKLHEAYKAALNIAKSDVSFSGYVNEKKDAKADAVEEDSAEKEFDFNTVKNSDENKADAENDEESETFQFSKSNHLQQPKAVDYEQNDNFDFQASIKMNALRRNNEVMEKTEIVISKANALYNQKFNDIERDWLNIFCADFVDEIMYEPVFLKELCRFLNSHKIYENMANAVYKSFNLGAITADSAGELEELYRIIDNARAQSYERLRIKIKLLWYIICILAGLTIVFFALNNLIGVFIVLLAAIFIILRISFLKKRKKDFYE